MTCRPPSCDFIKKDHLILGWCGSVDWVPACEPKGHGFDSQSGHMPGLGARSPDGGVWKATTHWCFSLSFSLTFSKNLINKIPKKSSQLKRPQELPVGYYKDTFRSPHNVNALPRKIFFFWIIVFSIWSSIWRQSTAAENSYKNTTSLKMVKQLNVNYFT